MNLINLASAKPPQSPGFNHEKCKIIGKYANLVIFQTSTGKVNVDVLFQGETLWLPQKGIAELFEKERSVITKHLNNIFLEDKLAEDAVCAKFSCTADDDTTRVFFITVQNKLLCVINQS